MSYSKIKISVVASEAADYQPATLRINLADFESTPAAYEESQLHAATGAGTTIDTSGFTTIDYFLLQNTDQTQSLSVTRKNAAGATVVDVVAPGDPYLVTDVDPTTNPIVTNLGLASMVFSLQIGGS